MDGGSEPKRGTNRHTFWHFSFFLATAQDLPLFFLIFEKLPCKSHQEDELNTLGVHRSSHTKFRKKLTDTRKIFSPIGDEIKQIRFGICSILYSQEEKRPLSTARDTGELFLPFEAGSTVLRPRLKPCDWAGSWEFHLRAMDHVKMSYRTKPGFFFKHINSCGRHLSFFWLPSIWTSFLVWGIAYTGRHGRKQGLSFSTESEKSRYQLLPPSKE